MRENEWHRRLATILDQPTDIEHELKKSFISLCHGGYHQPGPARRAGRAEARTPAHPVRHERAGHDARTSPSARCARIVGDVLGKYHPHGDSRRIRRHGAPGPGFQHPLSRWWRARATSAPWTATARPPCVIPRRGMSKLTMRADGEISTRIPWTSIPTLTRP